MREMTDLSTAHARQLRDEDPWCWLYEFEVPTDPPTRYRLTNYTEPITFMASSAGVPLVFSPFPIAHSDIRETLEGDLTQFQIQVGSSAALAAILDQYDGLHGQPVRVFLVNREDLANASSASEFVAQVAGCRIASDRVTLAIGALGLQDAVVPPLRFQRHHCVHEYGGMACGYDLTNSSLLAAFPACARTFEACVEHGDAEVAAGLTRKHAQRFGGWRSMPRGSR